MLDYLGCCFDVGGNVILDCRLLWHVNRQGALQRFLTQPHGNACGPFDFCLAFGQQFVQSVRGQVGLLAQEETIVNEWSHLDLMLLEEALHDTENLALDFKRVVTVQADGGLLFVLLLYVL